MKEKLEKQFGIRLPQGLWEKVQRQAERELINPSIFIRRAVVREIERISKSEVKNENDK